MKFLFPAVILMAVAVSAALVPACSKTNSADSAASLSGSGTIFITVRSTGTGINLDTELWEDRVDELRMMVFDSADGDVVYNEKLYFPNGFNNRCRPVELRAGTYDFYFIANESVCGDDFIQALLGVGNSSRFVSDAVFRTISYDTEFTPDGTSRGGRFLMSAVYENITVEKGGTEANPVLLALPTTKVELIRSMAKVEVVFRKRTPGSEVPAASEVGSVRLDDVAYELSVPPYDGYYTGPTGSSLRAATDGFDYLRDSIGAVTFYIPEFLVPEGSTSTVLNIDNSTFPIQTIDVSEGMAVQRRTVPDISEFSVVRNYHYTVNAYLTVGGGIEVDVEVVPWQKDRYRYLFEGDLSLVIPPVFPTDSSVIFPSDCGKVEILSHNEPLEGGLQAYFGDTVDWNESAIVRGAPPFPCEEKYGEGWRLINACELMSFFALVDAAYRVWTSYTWDSRNAGLTIYPMLLRQAAQPVLEALVGVDLSGSVFVDEKENPYSADQLSDTGLGGMIYSYFTPGDIVIVEDDYATWPYPGAPANDGLTWYPMEVAIQLARPWDSHYLSPEVRANWYTILYSEFERYDYSTWSRCVRRVD